MIEFEVTIPEIGIEEARRRLRECGAEPRRAMHLQKNIMFRLPPGREIAGGWIRVREEAERVTMSLKIVDGDGIADQREYLFMAENVKDACEFLQKMGAEEKARSEKRREIWILAGCEVAIDEWPFLEPLMEVEGRSEAAVKATVELLGFEYGKCRVCAVDKLYSEKYGVPEDIVDNHTPLLIFDMPNPFTIPKD